MDFTHLLRPKSFDDIVGQKHLTAPDAPLHVLVKKGVLTHSFLYGNAGVGKTSLARVIADEMKLPFYELNATSLKVEQLRKIFDTHKNTLQKPLIFIDEVHRLSKTQQEVLLPVMENNSVLIIGASTSNPFYSLTSAIRSRSMLFELKPIPYEELEKLLDKTDVEFKKGAKNYLIKSSGADARAMLKLLEMALHVEDVITLKTLKSLRPNALGSGVSEDGIHYDLTSALIKSIRGSDLDASIYYLARLIEGGESAEFIARRLVILASEDVGNANPQALTLTTSTLTSVKNIGFPEARIILAQAVVYLCASPKSNSSYKAINKALELVRDGEIFEVPQNIKDKPTNYKNPHNYNRFVKQKYLQKDLNLVELKGIGYEKKMKEWLEIIYIKN